MRRRTVLTGVLVWVLVVVAASAVTWAVIDGAGEDLMANGERIESQPVPLTSSDSPASSAPLSRGPETAPSSDRPSASASPGTPSGPSTSASAAPGGVERVWQGQAGLLAVRCEGGLAYNRGATPANGYRVEVEHSGTRTLEVTFKSATREYKVATTCAGGVPRFVLQGGGESHDD